MSIGVNITKIYLNPDRTIIPEYTEHPFVSRGQNNTWVIMMVAPFNIMNSHYVNFGLENEIAVPTRYMTLMGVENSDKTGNEDWGVWYYTVGSKITMGAASNNSDKLNITFSEFKNTTDSEVYTFVGFQSTVTELNANFPTPADDLYVGVGQGTTLGTSICYLSIAGEWITQEKTVYQFELDNNILREEFVGESAIIELGIDPNVKGIVDEVDNTNLDVIFADMSILSGKVTQLESLLGSDGINFIKAAISSEYVEKTSLDADDTFYIYTNSGERRHVTFGNLLDESREVFVGTFVTASGLVCPDTDDLICTYPNSIANPEDRIGWYASVTSTETIWRWNISSSQWFDTGISPSTASDISYDNSSDPSTSTDNVQDALVQHGQKIKTNEDNVDVLITRTQKFDITTGDIKEDIEVASGKDIESSDLFVASGYAGVIQALIAFYGINQTQDNGISQNASDIGERLVKDFSTLLNKSNPSSSDLLVLFDGSTNKNISFYELVTAIEEQIQYYQGYFVSLAALKSAIPTGQAGWYATLGDDDTQAVWDVETSDWIVSGIKLYFTQTAGDGLEVRITTNENDISSIQATLTNKENVSNKKVSMVGNESSNTHYLTSKAIYDYFNPIKIINEENRKYNIATQTGNTIIRNSTDTSLYNGRVERIKITGGIQAGTNDALFSIDGGSTNRPITLYRNASGLYENVDLSTSTIFGERFILVYDVNLDKWIVVLTDQTLSRLAGTGYISSMSIAGNNTLIQNLENRVEVIESSSISGKAFALAQVELTTPITDIDDTSGWVKVTFDTTPSITPNSSDVVDVLNGEIVIKEDAEPGYEFSVNANVIETGTNDLEIQFGLFNKADTIIEANLLDDFTIFIENGNDPTDKSKLIKISNERLATLTGGFPLTFVVYARIVNNSGAEATINECNFTISSLFTGGGAGSSTSTVLSEPSTETRNGGFITQQEHNIESVNDRKNLLESDNVILATYQSAGLYIANKPNIVLNTNKIITVLFTGIGSDVSELVKLSLDNGTTSYDVEYRETEVDLLCENAIKYVMDLYFTGTKFIVTGVFDSSLNYQTNGLGAYSSAVLTQHTGIADTNADFYVDITTLSSGDVYRVTVPTLTDNTANARFSGDGGDTYYNVKLNDMFVKGSDIEGQDIELKFDGSIVELIEFVDDTEVSYVERNELYNWKRNHKVFPIQVTAGAFDFSVNTGNPTWYFDEVPAEIGANTSTSLNPTCTLTKSQIVYLVVDNFSTSTFELKDNGTDARYVGDLKDLPALTNYLNLGNCTNVTGSLTDLPALTNLLSLYNCTNVTGSLTDLPALTNYLRLINCTNVTGVLPTTVTTSVIYLNNTGLSSSDVDSTIANIVTVGKSNGTLQLTGLTRTASSSANITTLISRGWSIADATIV
jgi:hypothetical protein